MAEQEQTPDYRLREQTLVDASASFYQQANHQSTEKQTNNQRCQHKFSRQKDALYGHWGEMAGQPVYHSPSPVAFRNT